MTIDHIRDAGTCTRVGETSSQALLAVLRINRGHDPKTSPVAAQQLATWLRSMHATRPLGVRSEPAVLLIEYFFETHPNYSSDLLAAMLEEVGQRVLPQDHETLMQFLQHLDTWTLGQADSLLRPHHRGSRYARTHLG